MYENSELSLPDYSQAKKRPYYSRNREKNSAYQLFLLMPCESH